MVSLGLEQPLALGQLGEHSRYLGLLVLDPALALEHRGLARCEGALPVSDLGVELGEPFLRVRELLLPRRQPFRDPCERAVALGGSLLAPLDRGPS